MKKSAFFLFLILSVLCGCSKNAAVDAAEYEISLKQIYTENTYISINVPKIFENKLFLCDLYSYRDGVSGNVTVIDLDTMESSKLNIFAETLFLYENGIYYRKGAETVRLDLETGEEEKLFSCGNPDSFFVYEDVEIGKECLVWQESDLEHTKTEYYSYDLKNGNIKLLAKTNHGSHALVKVRNGFISYSEEIDSTHYIYAADVSTGKTILLTEGTGYEPIRAVYDGETLVWSSRGKLHIVKDGEEKLLLVGPRTLDVDIFAGRYVVFCADRKIQVYDAEKESVVFSSGEEYPEFEFGWFSLNEADGSCAFTAANYEEAEEMYPNWEYDFSPEFVFFLSFDKIEDGK